jgi:TetR/AcrR family transcriptional regulator, regulator of biofilm formation and stress response
MAQRDEVERPGYSEGRDALLDATVRVIAEHGLRGLTYRRVAATAGTTHALVSYHFGSRDALILEAAARANAESLAGTSFDAPPSRAEDFARELPDRAAREADDHAFQFELAVEARRRPDLRDAVRSRYEGYLAATRQALRALDIDLGEDETAAARLLFAAIDGLMLQQLIFEDPESTRDALAILQRLLGELQDRG